MTTPTRMMWMDQEMREALAEYAWLQRTSMAEVIRAAASGVRDHPEDESVLSDDDAPSVVHVNFKIDDELWSAAAEAALSVGQSRSSLIRRRIRKLLQDEGLL